MLEKILKLFHLLDEEKECIIGDSIDEKIQIHFLMNFKIQNFSFIQFLIIIEN